MPNPLVGLLEEATQRAEFVTQKWVRDTLQQALVMAREQERERENAIGLATLEPGKHERAGREWMFRAILRQTNNSRAWVTAEWLHDHESELLSGLEPKP